MGLFGGRHRIEGTFTVTGTSVRLDEDGDRQIRFSGVVSGPGVPATAVQEFRHYPAGQPVPAAGDALPALIDPDKPKRFTVNWPARVSPAVQALADKAHAEQVAAALRLGLDAAVVPPPSAPATSVRALADAELRHRYGNDLLPDGNRPVSKDEADRFYTEGEAATAVITGVDDVPVPAKALPSPDASIVNVALRVRRADGTEYVTTARFGYRNAARRARFGQIGVTVPVRLDPADPKRACLDSPALPPH